MIVALEIGDLLLEIVICIVMTELYGEYNDIRKKEFAVATLHGSVTAPAELTTNYWRLIIFAVASILFDLF